MNPILDGIVRTAVAVLSRLTDLAHSLRREPVALAVALSISLAGLTGLVIADGFLRTGWVAVWHVTHEGRRVELRRTTEHHVAFVNDRRALARYVHHWDFRRFGMPAALPPIDVTLHARLEVPDGGRILRTDAEGHTAVRVDGAPLRADERVTAGPHDLEVDWSCALDAAPRFALRWGTTPVALDEVPRWALTPGACSSGDGVWPWSRVGLWFVGAPLVVVLATLAFRATRARGLEHRRHLAALATLLVLATGLGFRLLDLEVSPDFRENEDELFAMWNGHSLLTEGTSRGWTLWPDAYASETTRDVGRIAEEHWFYRRFHVVSPYFEHPPLLHVLVGVAGWIGGARSHLEVSHAAARLVPVALSVVVMLLMLAIGRRLDRGSPAPWLGTLLWAALPWIALQTRVVKEEVLVTPLALASLLAFLEWRDHPRRRPLASDAPRVVGSTRGADRATRWLVLASVLAASACWAKVTGLAFSLALAVLVARVGRPRDVGVVLGAAAVAVGLLALYGAAQGWDAFLFAQGLQTSRPVHFNLFLRFFDAPQINHSFVGRGWLLFLWLAAMAAFFSRARRDTAVLVVPLFTYLVAIGLGAGSWSFGWYLTPLLPFLCLGAGRFLADLWREPDLGRGAVLVLTLVFYSLNFATSETYFFSPATDPEEPRPLVTAVLAAFLVPFGLAQAFGWRAVGRVGLVASLVTMLVVSAAFLGSYDAIPHRDFDHNRALGP